METTLLLGTTRGGYLG